jgi:hypothetical protein
MRVSDNADHQRPVIRPGPRRECDALTDGALSRPVPVRERAIHYRDALRSRKILGREVTPVEHRYANCAEVPRRDEAIDHERGFVVRGNRLSFCVKADAAAVLIERQSAHAGRIDHTRQRTQVGCQTLEERQPLAGAWITRVR